MIALASCATAVAASVSMLLFANVGVGAVVPNPEMGTLNGETTSLLGDRQVTVLVFFHPEHDRSREVLDQLATLQEETTDGVVRWTGIVSDRFAPDAVRAVVEATGIQLEILVDAGDELYGQLGVRLYPSVGIVRADQNLAAYLPYTKVNFLGAVRGQLRFTLGEIDEQQLAAALEPERVEWGGADAAVQRKLKLAQMLLNAGKLDSALETARACVTEAPDLAAAHAMVGAVLVAQEDCDAARESLRRALELDPGEAVAGAALETCGP